MKSTARTALAALALAALHASPSLAAEPAVARLAAVTGNVLVSHASSISSADSGARLPVGARVLVTGNSAATIELAGGCRVRLAAGERYEVREGGCDGKRVAAGEAGAKEPRS